MSATHATIHRQDYTAPAIRIDHVELDVIIQAEHTIVQSTLDFAYDQSAGYFTLHGHQLTIESLAINGAELTADRYTYDGKLLTISDMPATGKLTSTVKIYPDQNTALNGFYRSGGMLTTQCEAEGFRCITFFNDRPDVLSTYQVRLEADRATYPVLLSNGNCIDKGESDNQRHFAVWQDPIPKPCYIFAMVAGDLAIDRDEFTTKSGRNVTLEIYTEPHNQDKTSFAMTSLKNAMRWDEERFDLEYDLDIFMIVAVDHFNMGAMENKGLNIFNTQCVLASPTTATDDEYRKIESIVGHEYFHNWTGNRITCRSWFELSLKEGLTVFRDQEFSTDMGAQDIQRIDDVAQLWAVQFAEDAGPFAHPVRPDAYQEIDNFYTPTVYDKGAEVVRLLHTRLGETGFQKGMQLYVERHDGQAVTCNDFVAAMADANNLDLSDYLIWYSQAGTPILSAKTAYDAEQQTLTITLSQRTEATPGQTEKSPLPMPVNFALFAPSGNPISFSLEGQTSQHGQLTLNSAEQSWTLSLDKNDDAEPVVSLLRGFSAPVQLDFDQTIDDRCHLLAHETDAFSRWAAAQSIFTDIILAQHATQYDEQQDGQRDEQENSTHKAALDKLIQALSTLLDSAQQTPELISKILDVPGYSVLINQLDHVDMDALTQARQNVIREIAKALNDRFADVYREMQPLDSGTYETAPQRALKNIALRYWGIGNADAHQVAVNQLHNPANMTDELAGLTTLISANSLNPSPSVAELLEAELSAFYERWSTDGQVVEKWLSLAAASLTTAHGIEGVKQLMQHPEFDLNNPNRVRNVVRGFVQNTPLFHRLDGAGYQVVADTIGKLDSNNPQMGAALCRAFSLWRKLDEQRQQHVERILRELRSQVSSPNVSEWLDRLLS